MTARPPRLGPLGDSAFTVTYADTIDDEAHRQVERHAWLIRSRLGDRIIEVVSAYSALTVHYDPSTVDAETLRDSLIPILAAPGIAGPRGDGRRVTIPVRYDGDDLGDVALATGLTIEDVIARHTSAEYRVYLLGFVPGFAYLGPLDPTLILPRRATPRPRVPAGSVAIAGAQTGVYPAATPGGWHLIGHTTVAMFDPAREPPALLAPGDRVRFVAER